MVVKQANNEYIVKEEIEFLGAPVGDNFIEPERQVAGYDSIKVELLSASNYAEWVNAALYASLVTWDTTPHLPVTKMQELSLEEKEKKLFFMLSKRPISVALEGALFTFKLIGVPRSFSHQFVRARNFSFGQQSYRVSSCYSDPIRIPMSLLEMEESELKTNLIFEFENTVKQCRAMYKKLIESGIEMENARNIMPMGTCTKIVGTMPLRHFIDYVKGRTSDIAQDEHTYIVCLMMEELKLKSPKFYDFIVSKVPTYPTIAAKYLK